MMLTCFLSPRSTRNTEWKSWKNVYKEANREHTLFSFPLKLSSRLFVDSPRLNDLTLKQATHSRLIGSQFLSKYVEAAGTSICARSVHCSSNTASLRAWAIALKMVSSASRCPLRTAIFSVVTSREMVRRVWKRHSWSDAVGKAAEKTRRSAMSLSVITTSVFGHVPLWPLKTCSNRGTAVFQNSFIMISVGTLSIIIADWLKFQSFNQALDCALLAIDHWKKKHHW